MPRQRPLGVFALVLLTAGLASCQLWTRPPSQPWRPEPMLTVWEETCRRVWREELGREIDAGGLTACIARQRDGATEDVVRTEVRQSDEWRQKHAPCPDGWTKQPDFSCTPPPLARLVAEGRRVVRADGQPFVWRFATAFRLVAQVAQGQEADAVSFLDWASTTGFTGVRVLAMARQLFDLPAEDGRAALPRLLQLAAARGLYVEVVILADTCPIFTGTCQADLPPEALEAQVRTVGAILARHDNAVAQIANEHYHETQTRLLHDPAIVERLGALLPDEILWTGSAAADQTVDGQVVAGDEWPGPPRGEYITRHLGRARAPWHMVRHVRELEMVSAVNDRFVVNGEPIGAAEADEPGRRSADPSVFLAFGALGRVLAIGSTFHFEDGLHARRPGLVQQSCAEAFIAGTRIAPDDAWLAFKNAGWADSPVARFRFDADGAQDSAVRVYSGVDGARGWTVVVGKVGDPGIEWQHGWQVRRLVADRPGVQVLEIGR